MGNTDAEASGGDLKGAVVVDPVTLGVLAAALVVKAAEKAGEKAVDAGAKGLGRLMAWLHERFSQENEEGVRALARVEDAPDSPSRIRDLAEVIDRQAAKDRSFRAGLEDLIRQVRDAGVDPGAVAQTIVGNDNTQIANTENSTITIGHSGAGGQSRPAGRHSAAGD